MLETITEIFANLHHQYTEQFVTALIPMILTVICHGWGMAIVRNYFRRFGPSITHSLSRTMRMLVVVVIVTIMLTTHYLEIIIWASFYFATDMIQTVRAAMSFSVQTYTTLGATNVILPVRWQGLEGFEALTAMLMFGWSTAMLVAVVQKLGAIES
ncbi:MAG TPA: hypothetical protein VEG25_01105 [Burkholderiales bacterium]|nr:hypothetical protein [Burkholderiales bacterium]